MDQNFYHQNGAGWGGSTGGPSRAAGPGAGAGENDIYRNRGAAGEDAAYRNADTAGGNGMYQNGTAGGTTGMYQNGAMGAGSGMAQGADHGSMYQNGMPGGTAGMHQNGSSAGMSGMHQNGSSAGMSGMYQDGSSAGMSGMHQNGSSAGTAGMYQSGTAAGGVGASENPVNGFGNGAYQSQGPQPGKKEKKKREKKERKPDGFGMKLVKCASYALVFGLVSGLVFEGVHYTSRQLSGEAQVTAEGQEQGSVLTQSDGNIKPTAVSETYVGMDVSDIVDATMPSIVAITNISETEYRSFWGSQQYESSSAGSGIIVSQDSEYLYIATNNHVVSGTKSLTVTFFDDSTVGAEVKGTAPGADLAVIKVPLESIDEETRANIKVATLGNSDELKVGNGSIAIGNALGYGQSVTTGCISALGREVSVSDAESDTNYTAELIQTEAAINPGNSGGALLNMAGEVIGINSVKYSDTKVEGIGYAIPINTAMPIIEDLITKEKVDESESAYLGIRGVDVTSDVSDDYGMPTGIFIAQVLEGTAAQDAGLKKGDILTEFDGRSVSSMEELTMLLQYYKAGDTVEVTILRATEGEYLEQTIQVTLGSKVG